MYIPKKPVTTGWQECEHKNWVGGLVCDPFVGSGTTAEVALKLGRRFVGIDLYDKNVEITTQRCVETLTEMTISPVDSERQIYYVQKAVRHYIERKA